MNKEIKNTYKIVVRKMSVSIMYVDCYARTLPLVRAFIFLVAVSHSTTLLILSSKINCVEVLIHYIIPLALSLIFCNTSMYRVMLLD